MNQQLKALISSRAATNIRFVRIFVRILVFGFDSFPFGIRLHGIYVIFGKNYHFLVQVDLYYNGLQLNMVIFSKLC